MQPHPAAPHPDARLSVRGLVRAQRAILPPGELPVGEKPIRDAIRVGKAQGGLEASRPSLRRLLIRWGDFTAWLDGKRVAPTPDQVPKRDAAASWAADRIAREDRGAA